MARFEEGGLLFEFGDRWQVCKLDDHPDYRNRIHKVDGTKAVDFLAILKHRDLYLIEVKDFRGHRIESKARLADGSLAIEVGQKVRDSIACIVGAQHTSSKPEDWQPFMERLCQGKHPIKVVIWLEQDATPRHQREKVRQSITANAFKQKLSWLTRRVWVCSQREYRLDDVKVSNLPRN